MSLPTAARYGLYALLAAAALVPVGIGILVGWWLL